MPIKYSYEDFINYKHDNTHDEDEINRINIKLGIKVKNYGSTQCAEEKKILMLLNKISKSNIITINKQIKELLVSSSIINFTIENIYKCAIKQPSFQSLYAEIFKNISHRNNSLKNIIKEVCNQILNTLNLKYDNNNNDNKENLRIFYEFISELYLAKVYSTNIVMDYFNILYIDIEKDNNKIEMLCSLIKNCYKNLNKNLGSDLFKQQIIDKLHNLINSNIKPRLKFMIKDITDNINI